MQIGTDGLSLAPALESTDESRHKAPAMLTRASSAASPHLMYTPVTSLFHQHVYKVHSIQPYSLHVIHTNYKSMPFPHTHIQSTQHDYKHEIYSQIHKCYLIEKIQLIDKNSTDMYMYIKKSMCKASFFYPIVFL